ncbi:MAG: transcription elongation factor GreA [Alphaproteobacteria bacterium]|jgi:transcription elongation factor GreA|nr:transcription elongation factor GreA [Alphaproteobacteria bacterium]MCV6599332.1 transcription elongation factor GreA [Alphaproteobacteria bacterium]
MDKYPMTEKCYNDMVAELKNLKSVERPAVIEAIADAREHGDLKENAEYHSAREKQSFIEGRIQELEAIVSRAQVINPLDFAGDSNVKFGATVQIVDEDTEEEKTLQIVGEFEGDISKGLISLTSPLARAMIGKSEGDSFEVITPAGKKFYEIEEVKYV